HAAVDVARALHQELQLEVGDFAALPDEIHRAGRLLARGFDHDRAVLDLPVVVARPAIQRAAIPEGDPAIVFLEIDRIRLSETASAASAGAAPASALRRTVWAGRGGTWRLRRWCAWRCGWCARRLRRW